MQDVDPIFHAYVFIATTTACLASNLDAACRYIFMQLEQLPRRNAALEMLRAHAVASR